MKRFKVNKLGCVASPGLGYVANERLWSQLHEGDIEDVATCTCGDV